MKIYATVKRGNAPGTVLTPHRHADGSFVVSMTRFERDYVRVADESELPHWIAKGFRVRMSNSSVPNHQAPSLIAPASITISGVLEEKEVRVTESRPLVIAAIATAFLVFVYFAWRAWLS